MNVLAPPSFFSRFVKVSHVEFYSTLIAHDALKHVSNPLGREKMAAIPRQTTRGDVWFVVKLGHGARQTTSVSSVSQFSDVHRFSEGPQTNDSHAKQDSPMTKRTSLGLDRRVRPW